MDFELSAKTKALQQRVSAFMDAYVYPAEADYTAEMAANTAAGKRWTPLQTIEKLKKKAKEEGLWNLFLPVDSAEVAGYQGG
jgi:acyl-CoA dehydrogenase